MDVLEELKQFLTTCDFDTMEKYFFADQNGLLTIATQTSTRGTPASELYTILTDVTAFDEKFFALLVRCILF